VFCHPEVLDSSGVRALLGTCDGMHEFGFKARVPLRPARFDRTEVDMKLGPLLIEAKLTETGFQLAPARVVEAYRGPEDVLERPALPRSAGQYISYQLIRNVLAAHALGLSFCVVLDQRRPDLLEAWYEIMKNVRITELRARCKVMTWQELSAVLPAEVQEFLDLKYGIVPPGRMPSPLEQP